MSGPRDANGLRPGDPPDCGRAGAFDFSTDYVTAFLPVWDFFVAERKPRTILEIGSFEGRSACYFIEEATRFGDVELHCIDTFEGSHEHVAMGLDLAGVEGRFDANTSLALSRLPGPHRCRLVKHKTDSFNGLAGMVADGFLEYFDLVYVDGSHFAHDVLKDLVLAFELLKTGGLMIADDYLWNEYNRGTVLQGISHPKPAIDAFININHFRIQIHQAPLYQVYMTKIDGQPA